MGPWSDCPRRPFSNHRSNSGWYEIIPIFIIRLIKPSKISSKQFLLSYFYSTYNWFSYKDASRSNNHLNSLKWKLLQTYYKTFKMIPKPSLNSNKTNILLKCLHIVINYWLVGFVWSPTYVVSAHVAQIQIESWQRQFNLASRAVTANVFQVPGESYCAIFCPATVVQKSLTPTVLLASHFGCISMQLTVSLWHYYTRKWIPPSFWKVDNGKQSSASSVE